MKLKNVLILPLGCFRTCSMTKKKKFKDFPGNLIKIKVLEDEISYFKTQIQEHDTGHIYTTIDTLKDRVRELKGIREEY